MEIMFLSDRDDPMLKSLYTYFSQLYKCEYGNNGEASLFVSNCVTSNPSRTIYFATDPSDYSSEITNRRLKIGFFQKAKYILCPSLYLAKMFYGKFRVNCEVQYPYYPPINHNPQKIVYHPKFGVDHSISVGALSHETFERYSDNLTDAKLYISSREIIDSNILEASSRGIPVVASNNIWFQEFLGQGDQIFQWGTTDWIMAVKKSLRDVGSKNSSGKYSNMSNLNEKIQKALDKKPTASNNFQPIKPKPQVMGRRPNRTVAPVRQPVNLPPISDKTIYITGSCIGISGYDNLVFETIKGLKSINADVRINSDNQINYSICPAWFEDVHVMKMPQTWEIIITPPCNFGFIAPNKKSIVLTMWETDHLDKEWVKSLNNAHLVCVPSQWAVECFKKSGVTIPIVCVPLGCDPLIFNPIGEFPKLCTFGTAAALTAGGLRKNTKFIIELFKQAFPTEQDVRLKVKISPACPLPECDDPRVEILRKMLPPAQLADWYRSITTFVNASYAEGFGLHLIEAMACGRPLISTHYSAVTEYFDESVGWITDHEIIEAAGGAYSGHWGKPVEKSIISNMRKVYENNESAKEKGEAAYFRSRNFTWKTFGNKLTKALKDYGVVNL